MYAAARVVCFIVFLLALLCVALGVWVSPYFYWGLVVFAPLSLLAVWDMVQKKHSICRNYPLLGRLRFLQEAIRPEWHQYFIESDTDGRPYSRVQRTLIYKRAKNIDGLQPFGTELDVYGDEYEWLTHSIAPHEKSEEHFRTNVGGPDCKKPYSCSLINISAMSYGAISPNAIRALNKGAKLGGFYHTTGEGGLSSYHKENGGDLVWQIGTGYFGCRNDDGTFNSDMFAEQAVIDSVKMIEIKVSQGAKPGHGGVLPAAKVTQEISNVRRVPMGQDCISPPGHSAFHTPVEMCHYIQQLRELSGGKPVGFKLCIGRPHEFMAICKAMRSTGILADFITVDGAEGGTGAAPPEFSDSLGTPLREGLILVQNCLVGSGLRDKIHIASSGKVASAFHVARNMGLGADWCNIARGFMMAVGCIQAQSCDTNRCPVGVATQDAKLQRALDVGDKSQRAFHFHHNMMESLSDIVAAAGLDHPQEFKPAHFCKRMGPTKLRTFEHAYDFLEKDELLQGTDHPHYKLWWEAASADTFAAQVDLMS
ncbi:FMN-binding glutamate synthase family protein [Bythopirellula goksoeyrii]|uniref:Glutamate synthase [NADPH] large chain n=1 Tax=Bythopirellula goksoeyrii TaxID=1400387 RepID=A0A5B9QDZ7_9BACT|nr:FMN-binding glutamate synthase family protein [Bythopirellula goksoeyrii]QEG37188.1 Glutamate synthase [NADPH] large chain precursor [Bythopirellula goksoeyrii]